MSYLEDNTIVLNRGCIDETGAQRYNKTANVPDNYVVDLQKDLQKLGLSPSTIDGDFGNRTTEALKDFQETAHSNQRLKNGTIIEVNPTYTGEAHGECNQETRQEIKRWLDLEYRAPWPVPPPWIGPEEPLQEHSIPFAPPSGQYWPIRTRDRGGREIAYKAQSGRIYGLGGRRFLAPRSGGQRYHVGIDLWGEAGDLIVACEDGKIVNHYNFYDGVDCLIVQCDSGIVINYGEVKSNSWQLFGLQNGSRVYAGQPIAVVGQMTNSAMCHFETYTQGTIKNYTYYPEQQPPSRLLNPTKYLLHLAAKGEPLPSAQTIIPPPPITEINFSRVDVDRLPNFSSLEQYHRAFSGGVRWRLVPRGIEIEGSGVERTSGNPVTTTRIWNKFGDFINQWAEYYQVPCVLIVATIATETSGNPDAMRKEPGYQSDELTPHKISVGLMQTLISTARDTLNDPNIDRQWLLQPSNSIKAGICYITQQKSVTVYDPPKVACAYNAGSIYQNTGENNRWKMRQYPIGTGEHCDRFVKWFNDAVAVLAAHDKKPSIPYEVYLC
jgi:murein DD-endopeptidase MepM/ murein hydrolase activator NlpD